MKATELRVGNWVYACLTKRYFQIDWIAVSHVARGNIQSVYDTSPVYEPIPLTPEILEKAGFVKWRNANTYEFPTPNGIIHLDMNDKELFIGGKDSCTHGMCYSFSIRYVHQLQNLIHSLTGEELQIKL